MLEISYLNVLAPELEIIDTLTNNSRMFALKGGVTHVDVLQIVC